MSALETLVWTGRGFNPECGTLRLDQGRLQFELEGRVAFDAPVPELRITWPWYGFGCQFWAHVGEQKYFISFLHTNNTIASWCRGIRKGRSWRRAIMSGLS